MKNKPLLTIFLIVFVDLLGFGIILPLLPFIAERFKANPAQIGFLSATYSFFQLISAPILGRLSDRWGRKKLLIVSQLGSTIGFIILGLAGNLPLLFLSRIIDGITGGNISIAQAYIADVTTNENRARGMGLIGAAFGLGFIFGPAIGGFLAQYGYSYPAYFATAVSLITVACTYFLLPETVDVKKAVHIERTKFNFREFKKVLLNPVIGYLIIVFFLLNTAFSIFQGNFSLWTQTKFGFGPAQNGFFFAYIGILAVFFQLWLLPRMVKRFHEKKLLRYSTFFLFLGLVFMPLIPSAAFLFITQLPIVLGNSLANPSIQALASENIPKEEYGGTLGFLQSAGGAGRILGPILGGEIFFHYGYDTPYFLAAVLLLLTFFYLHVKLRKA
jgi:DHA1 family tetracycline resistance protein-like MFS transporter